MIVALIFAGGSGQRMNHPECPKQFIEVCGKPLMVHTLEVFQSHPEIDAIAVSCIAGWEDFLKSECEKWGITKLKIMVPGGSTSQESKLHGLRALRDHCSDDDIILMHDGVRPLIDHETISRNIDSVRKYGNAVTVRQFSETGTICSDEGCIIDTLERDHLFIAKAPQSFRFKDALDAHEAAESLPASKTIDTCTIMSALGKTLHTVPSNSYNVKITFPEDILVFEALYEFVHQNACKHQ